MLNGKFFTGLPPKMIERGGNGTPNRQESHFYWPDDAHAETAVETRQKRRTSLQTGAGINATTNRPQLQQQFSIGENEVDTKQMFQKEFAKSSIQFYDNLEDSQASSNNRTRNKAHAHTMKRDIACKPTAMKLDLPVSSDIDDDYAHAKKQQTFASKIQFYDFVDEQPGREQRNNARKPRMDINDKRELEKNTKNSPKLQTKKSFANSRENLRENGYTNELGYGQRGQAKTVRNTANAGISRELYDRANAVRNNGTEHDYINNDGDEFADYNEREQFSADRELPTERKVTYMREMEKRAYRAKSEDPKHDMLPKRILKTTTQNSRDSLNGHTETDELDNAMSLLYTRRPTPRPVKKHVTYRDDYEEYMEDEIPMHANRQRVVRDFDDADDDGDDLSENLHVRPNGLRKSATAPNLKAGNTQRQPQKQIHNQNPNRRNEQTQRQYMETGSGARETTAAARATPTAIKKSLNNQHDINYNNRVNGRQNNYNNNDSYNNTNYSNKSNNRTHFDNKQQQQQQQNDTINRERRNQNIADANYNGHSNGSMTSSPTTATAAAAMTTQRHLRSSLCFNDGAIVADNSKTTTMTPTAQQARRNARSSATQRVSVGLPD